MMCSTIASAVWLASSPGLFFRFVFDFRVLLVVRFRITEILACVCWKVNVPTSGGRFKRYQYQLYGNGIFSSLRLLNGVRLVICEPSARQIFFPLQ